MLYKFKAIYWAANCLYTGFASYFAYLFSSLLVVQTVWKILGWLWVFKHVSSASFALAHFGSLMRALSQSPSLGFGDCLAGLGLDALSLGYVTTVDVGVSSVSVSVSKFFPIRVKNTSNCALRILTVSLSVSVLVFVCVRKIIKTNTIRLHFTACTSTKYSQCTQMPKIL